MFVNAKLYLIWNWSNELISKTGSRGIKIYHDKNMTFDTVTVWHEIPELKQNIFISNLPRHNDHKVHDIPHVAKIRVFMKNESHGNDFGAHFHSKDNHKDYLKLLQLQGQDGLVVVGDPGVHGHDDTIGHDGDDDQPFKWRPGHKPNKQSSGISI